MTGIWAEGKGDNLKQIPDPAWSHTQAPSHNPEIMTRDAVKTRTLNGLSYPGAPK